MQIPPPERIGVVVVDHGSRRDESNQMLLEIVSMFQEQSHYTIVEAAHMDLAEPSIKTAFGRCVERGAELVLIHPYFLLPGRHWDQDIPALASDASREHGNVPFLVTAPLGRHPLMAEIIEQRIQHCLDRAKGQAEPCDICRDGDGCMVREVE